MIEFTDLAGRCICIDPMAINVVEEVTPDVWLVSAGSVYAVSGETAAIVRAKKSLTGEMEDDEDEAWKRGEGGL